VLSPEAQGAVVLGSRDYFIDVGGMDCASVDLSDRHRGIEVHKRRIVLRRHAARLRSIHPTVVAEVKAVSRGIIADEVEAVLIHVDLEG
jgi:hypothetical protein